MNTLEYELVMKEGSVLWHFMSYLNLAQSYTFFSQTASKLKIKVN